MWSLVLEKKYGEGCLQSNKYMSQEEVEIKKIYRVETAQSQSVPPQYSVLSTMYDFGKSSFDKLLTAWMNGYKSTEENNV